MPLIHISGHAIDTDDIVSVENVNEIRCDFNHETELFEATYRHRLTSVDYDYFHPVPFKNLPSSQVLSVMRLRDGSDIKINNSARSVLDKINKATGNHHAFIMCDKLGEHREDDKLCQEALLINPAYIADVSDIETRHYENNSLNERFDIDIVVNGVNRRYHRPYVGCDDIRSCITTICGNKLKQTHLVTHTADQIRQLM